MHNLAPGDTLALTSCIASLHKAYPGQYAVGFRGTWDREIFQGNPGVKPIPPHQSHVAEMHYNAINDLSRRDVSFLQAFHEHLAGIIMRPLPVLVSKPQLFLNEQEQANRVPGTEGIGPYVVGNFGSKSDYPTKTPSRHIWQSVVTALKDRVTFVQVGEANPSHLHPPIEGAVNLIGKTTPRQLFQLVHHSLAALSPVSLLHHVAAALDRVCITVGGARESPNWITYETTQYLHCLGALPCAVPGGCWKSFVSATETGEKFCSLPVLAPDGSVVPKCHEIACGRNGERIISTLEMILHTKGI